MTDSIVFSFNVNGLQVDVVKRFHILQSTFNGQKMLHPFTVILNFNWND